MTSGEADTLRRELSVANEATMALHADVARLGRELTEANAELAEACRAAKEHRDAHYLESVRADAAEARLAEAQAEVERLKTGVSGKRAQTLLRR